MKKLLVLITLLLILSGCSAIAMEPPDASVKVSGDKIQLKKGTYEWGKENFFGGGSVTAADAASPWQIAEEMEAVEIGAGDEATVVFSDKSNPEIQVFLWDDEKRGAELTIKEGSFKIPAEAGRHVIEVWAEWPNGNASYTVLLQVK